MTFIERMQAVQKAACFRTTDMATWFGISRAVMHNWLNALRTPYRTTQAQLEPDLLLLEKTLTSLSTKKLLPVPLSITQYDRKAYIEKVKGHATQRFSATHTAPRRGKMLGINK